MLRPSVVAFSGCLYVALSVWIVGKQGEAYRESLDRDRLAAAGAEKPSPPPAESQPAVQAAAAPETTISGPEPTAPSSVAVATPLAGRVAGKTQPAQPTAGLGEVNPKPSPRGDRAPDPAAGKGAPGADPLANDPFWNQPQLTRNWDLANLSATDELRLGAELHDVIVQLNPVCDDGPWLSRVEDAAKPLLKTLIRKEIRYTFTILDSDAVNAFSHPGGYVYVSRGLFDLIGEDEDYALQFAVGCEIAHVDLQHAIRCLQDPGVRKMTDGTLRKLYWLVIPFGYLVSDKVNQDFQADEWVFNRMRSLGRTNRETLAFLKKLDGYAAKHGFKNGQAKVRLGPDSSLLDIHYRRQTAAWRRLDHLKESFK